MDTQVKRGSGLGSVISFIISLSQIAQRHSKIAKLIRVEHIIEMS